MKELQAEIKLEKVNDRVVDWEYGDYSGTIIMHNDERRNPEFQWDYDEPENYEDIEEAILAKLPSVLAPKKPVIYAVTQKGLTEFFTDDDIAIVHIDTDVENPEYGSQPSESIELLIKRFPIHYWKSKLDLTVGQEYVFPHDNGTYQGTHGNDFMFRMEGSYYVEEDIMDSRRTTAGVALAGLVRMPYDVVCEMLQRQ